MTADDIKQAIADGASVYWSNPGYEVIRDAIGQHLIRCTWNNHCIGLTTHAGALNGSPEDFHITPKKYEAPAQKGLFFWADPIDTDLAGRIPRTVYGITAQAEGYPASEAHDDWFGRYKDADQIAQQLAAEYVRG